MAVGGVAAARPAVAALLAVAAAVAAGCGAGAGAGTGTRTGGSPGIPAALIRESRPIGRAPRFHPAAPSTVTGPCRPRLGTRVGAHVELFAANRVMLIAAGIGTRPPRTRSEGRIDGARCYGRLVTLDPTGVVLVAPGPRRTLADLFAAWRQPLSAHRLASFAGAVRVYVNGRRRRESPGSVALTRHAEIVLEVGPYVPPHTAYGFPPGA